MDALFAALADEQMNQRAAEMGRPLVTLSYAQSLDGSLTVARGHPTPLSGGESLRLTHRLRAAHQGILVGVGTVLADDPQLSVRLAEGKSPRPLVLDTHLRLPMEAKLLRRANNQPWILCSEAAAQLPRASLLAEKGCRILACPLDSAGRLELREGLRSIMRQGVRSVMVEGGASVITSVLQSRLFDWAVVTISPAWLGGLAAVEQRLGQEGRWPALVDVHYVPCGADLVVWGRAGEVAL